MTRTRIGSWILCVVVLLLLVFRPISAVGPAVIVIHGGELQPPLIVRPEIGSFIFMWGGGTRMYDRRGVNAIPSGLEGRRYLDYDVYWGLFTPDELKPEAASQHGRLYLPTPDQPAAVVLTDPAMCCSGPNDAHVPARPVPSQLKDFASGRALLPDETAALVAVGVPMKMN